MNNPTVLKSVSIVAFVISAIFTIMLMTSGTIGMFSFVLTAAMGLVLELAKCGFFYEALANTALNGAVRATMIAISLILIISSILASAAYIQNQANKTKNRQIQSSSQYKQLEQAKATQQDLYETKKREIEGLKVLQQNQQTAGDKIINSMPKNYIDRKNAQRASTASQMADTQKIIDRKSSELSQIGATLQSPIDTSGLKINSENGYTAMFKTMASIVNKSESYKDNPIDSDALEMWFFIILGVIFELVAVLTAYLAQLKRKSISPTLKKTSVQESNIGFKPQVVTAHNDNESIQAKRQIGFRASSPPSESKTDKIKSLETLSTTDFYNPSTNVPDINIDDIKKYVEYMYSNLKNGNESKGYNPIGQFTGVGVENARKIKAYLERLGIIKTIGTKTFVLCDLQACKAKVQA